MIRPLHESNTESLEYNRFFTYFDRIQHFYHSHRASSLYTYCLIVVVGVVIAAAAAADAVTAVRQESTFTHAKKRSKRKKKQRKNQEKGKKYTTHEIRGNSRKSGLVFIEHPLESFESTLVILFLRKTQKLAFDQIRTNYRTNSHKHFLLFFLLLLSVSSISM